MVLKKCIRFSVLFALTIFFALAACGQPATTSNIHTDAFLENMLKQYPQYFDSVLANRKLNNVQVIYTSIDRGANGIAGLKNFYFNVNSNGYFNPGSSIKLPIAMLTFQKLIELKANGIDKNTTMLTEKAYSGQTAVYNDPTTPNGKPTIAQYLKKMLMADDSDACNRLYELLGQKYINEQLHQKNYSNAQITQRIDLDLTEDENRHTNPVQFLAPGNKVLYRQPMQFYTGTFDGTDLFFTKDNKINLEDLHAMLVSLAFPNKVTSTQRFSIGDDDRQYLLKYMSEWPTESSNPPYSDDTATYYKALGKYLLYGAQRGSMPDSIRVFNIQSKAWGQIIDVAYIVDFEKKIEFFLSAVISCKHDNGNKNDYDYETVGLPFMKQLGQVIYQYETKREKRITPDLNDMKFDYKGK